jgi:hypothetical protein
MLPTDDQIRHASYDLWQRRGRVHGSDRQDWYAAERELIFSNNYHTIVDYAFDLPGMLVLGDQPVRYCRFCERTTAFAAFTAARPVAQGIGRTSLFTEGICDDCQARCREPLVADLERFWNALPGVGFGDDDGQLPCSRNLYTVVVLKSLVASALLIMPESELPYFVDAQEWVSNPDPRHDSRLFAGSVCRVYAAPFLRGRSGCSLARRIDTDLPLPYMLLFLSRGGFVLQVQLPLCLRDQDLDGRTVLIPERSLVEGAGSQFQESRSTVLPLVTAVGTPPVESRPRSRAV